MTTVTPLTTLAMAVNPIAALFELRVSVKAASGVVAKLTCMLKVTVRLVMRERGAEPSLTCTLLTVGGMAGGSTHNSRPWTPSSATKYSEPFSTLKLPGPNPPGMSGCRDSGRRSSVCRSPAVALPQLLAVLAVVGREKQSAVHVYQGGGTRIGSAGSMSLTITVPTGVPLLVHNSFPCATSLAAKNSFPLTTVRSSMARR